MYMLSPCLLFFFVDLESSFFMAMKPVVSLRGAGWAYKYPDFIAERFLENPIMC